MRLAISLLAHSFPPLRGKAGMGGSLVRKRRTIRLMFKLFPFLFFLMLFFPLLSQAVPVTDDSGQQLNLPATPKRVISLAPDVTDAIVAIGAGDKLVGVVPGNNPVAWPVVGSASGLDLERIASLHPDLIIVWGNMFPRQMAVFRRMGIPIYVNDPHHLTDIPHLLENLGQLLSRRAMAKKVANQFNEQIERLRQANLNKPKLTVYYQIGNYSLITINQNSWINDVITLCGGQNIMAKSHISAPEISWEALFAANPQVILSDATASDWKKRFLAHPALVAVKKENLFQVNADTLDRAGVSLIEGARQVCLALNQARAKINLASD
jgi:iron complex transport system substrate-binding protein